MARFSLFSRHTLHTSSAVTLYWSIFDQEGDAGRLSLEILLLAGEGDLDLDLDGETGDFERLGSLD